MSQSTDLPIHRWSAREYFQLAEHGILRGERVRLINGEIIEMSA